MLLFSSTGFYRSPGDRASVQLPSFVQLVTWSETQKILTTGQERLCSCISSQRRIPLVDFAHFPEAVPLCSSQEDMVSCPPTQQRTGDQGDHWWSLGQSEGRLAMLRLLTPYQPLPTFTNHWVSPSRGQEVLPLLTRPCEREFWCAQKQTLPLHTSLLVGW